METNNEENLPITENIVETDENEQDEELVSQLADTLERPIVNSKNTTKRPRSQAQVKAFAKARLALDEKRKLDRERKQSEKKPVGRPKKKEKVKEPPVESVKSVVRKKDYAEEVTVQRQRAASVADPGSRNERTCPERGRLACL